MGFVVVQRNGRGSTRGFESVFVVWSSLVRVFEAGFCLLLLGCNGASKSTNGNTDSGGWDGERLASLPRSEVIARADQLANLAEHAKPGAAAPLLNEAAKLRESVWRFERRKADALEAIELYAEAGKKGDCLSQIRSAALRAEAEIEPGRPIGHYGKARHSSVPSIVSPRRSA